MQLILIIVYIEVNPGQYIFYSVLSNICFRYLIDIIPIVNQDVICVNKISFSQLFPKECYYIYSKYKLKTFSQRMQKNSYFPSPLRKDYTTKPVKNFIPIIIAQTSRQGTSRDKNPQDQKIIKYKDGLLVKILHTNNIKSGIFFMDDHSCILYNLQDEQVHGKNYIIYPSGVIMSANYQHGKLSRWLIVIFEGKFIVCYHYWRGIKESEQYYYDFSDELLIISLYSKGKLVQIKNGQVGQFHKIVKNEQILQRVQQLQSKRFSLNKNFPSLKLTQLSYYGELNQSKDTPNGYGIMIGQSQIFMGNFAKGVLHGLGAIKFENNDFYFGQFNQGLCVGYGSINDGKHTTYQFGNQTVQKIQFDQFIGMVSVPDNQQKWANKFKDLQAFHHQFRDKLMWQQKQNTKQSKQNSIANLQVAESHHMQRSSQEQQDFLQEDDQQILHSFSKHKKNNIPMLSLAKSIQVKRAQNQQIGTASQRGKEQPLNKLKIERQQSRTQRHIDKQQNTPYLKVPDIKNQRIHNTETKKKAHLFNHSARQEHLGTQNVKIDKQYISKQYHFMRPNQMQIKQKMNRIMKEKLEKNWNSTKINMGKIMKVGSDVSQERQENFIKNFKYNF